MSLDWLYTAIAFVLKLWHSAFTGLGLDPDAGITWALSIFFLVVTVRILLFRFFIKQVQSQRSMQELQPEIAKLKKEYGADRQGMAAAQQALFKDRGVNPLAGCLPIVLQAPVFISLFHVLRRLTPTAQGLYSWDNDLTESAARASLFGAPISSSFNMDPDKASAIFSISNDITYTSIRTVALTLMILMSITTFITQKQIMRKSGPVEGQAAMIQKFMLYVIPVSLFVSGFFFPIGVLLYWFMNNLWTMGQQFYILHKHPPKKAGDLAVDRPVVDGKTLAPKPGARPSNPKNARPGNGSAPANGSSPAGDPTSGNGSSPGNGSGPVSTTKPTTKAARNGSSRVSTAKSGPTSGPSTASNGAGPRAGANDPVSLNKAPAAGARAPGSAKSPAASRSKRKKR